MHMCIYTHIIMCVYIYIYIYIYISEGSTQAEWSGPAIVSLLYTLVSISTSILIVLLVLLVLLVLYTLVYISSISPIYICIYLLVY